MEETDGAMGESDYEYKIALDDWSRVNAVKNWLIEAEKIGVEFEYDASMPLGNLEENINKCFPETEGKETRNNLRKICVSHLGLRPLPSSLSRMCSSLKRGLGSMVSMGCGSSKSAESLVRHNPVTRPNDYQLLNFYSESLPQ